MKWNSRLYVSKHAFVYQYGEELIDLLNPQEGELILDLGCGTGQLTEKIAQRGAKVIGIDSAPSMVEAARQQHPAIDFQRMDAQALDFPFKFDAIFSNAVLHWVPDQKRLAKGMFEHLKQEGRLVVEFGGKGNVGHIIEKLIEVLAEKGYAARSPWYFPSLGAHCSLLEEIGFRVLSAQHFDRDTELEDSESGMADWINMFGKSFLDQVPEDLREEILLRTVKRLRATNYKNEKWYADYKRLRIIAVKSAF